MREGCNCGTGCAVHECMLVQVSCNRVREIVCVRTKMRYGPHVTSNDRAPAPAPRAARCAACSARQKRPLRASNQPSRQPTFDLLLQAVVVEQVGNNTIQDTSYGMGFSRANRRFDARKPVTGGEGVRPVITTATAIHSTPQIFYLQLARMRACPTPVAWPTVASATVV